MPCHGYTFLHTVAMLSSIQELGHIIYTHRKLIFYRKRSFVIVNFALILSNDHLLDHLPEQEFYILKFSVCLHIHSCIQPVVVNVFYVLLGIIHVCYSCTNVLGSREFVYI